MKLHHEKIPWKSLTVAVASVLILGLLCGCSFRAPTVLTPELRDRILQSGNDSALSPLGHISIYIGGIVLLVAGLARVACFFPATAFLLVFAPLMGEAAALAATAIILGSCLVWLGLHMWVLYVAILALGLVYGLKHIDSIRAFFASLKSKFGSVKTDDTV